jgi:hypothetical protein
MPYGQVCHASATRRHPSVVCAANLPRVGIAEVQTSEGELFLFVGIDRTSKYAVTQLAEKADIKTAWEFRQHMLEAVPYQLHTILTDNGVHFAEQPRQTERSNG